MRRATESQPPCGHPTKDFYPRSPCGERPTVLTLICEVIAISIHALLAESDVMAAPITPTYENISIHALLAESDPFEKFEGVTAIKISIHALLAESDSPPSITPTASRNFYPRSPCGERPYTNKQMEVHTIFLSTLSLRRATANWFDLWGWAEYFYPRSPCGERPTRKSEPFTAYLISIHALLAESDVTAIE